MRFNRIFLLFCALLLVLTACSPGVAATPVEGTRSEPFLSQLTFLGDSITAHMAARSPIEKDRIWCAKNRYLNLDSRITYAKIIAPDTGEEQTIAEVAERIRPQYLVITLGVDYGVYYYRNEPQTFVFYYEKLLDAIAAASPDTVLLVQSILPVTSASTAITNGMIDNANAALRALCERKGLFYLDTQSVLRDEEGFLRAEYCNSADGIHLSEAGYDAMLGYIEKMEGEITE